MLLSKHTNTSYAFNPDCAAILRVVSAVLHLGNIEFHQEKKSDQAMLNDDTVAQKACHLLGLQPKDIVKAFLRPKVKVGRDYVTKAQNQEQVCSFEYARLLPICHF